jgi:hypothetical protein
MKPENLTAQESLDIITAMIREAKGNVQRNNFFFLLWGWVVMLANLGMFMLMQMGYRHPYVVWAITIPAWIITIVVGFRQGRRINSPTHFDKISGALWLSFSVVLFTIVAFGFKFNYLINPLILTLCAIPTFVSGVILKFRPLLVGGTLFWLFGIAGFLVAREYQPLVGAVAITCGYLIPGYMLRSVKA